MAEGEKKYLSVLDDDGASHEVSLEPFNDYGFRSVKGYEYLAFVPLDPLPSDKKSMRRFDGEMPLGSQTDYPVDVLRQMSRQWSFAYLAKSGEPIGIFFTYMAKGIDLDAFLDLPKVSDLACVQVARNLCTVVLAASRAGAPLKCIQSEQILVDPATCRVFIGPSFGRPYADSYSLILHIYALLHRSRGALLEKTMRYAFADEKTPTRAPGRSIANAIIDVTRKPFLVSEMGELGLSESFQSPFWDEPKPLRRVYDRYLVNLPEASMEIIAADFLHALGQKAASSRSLLSRLSDIREFLQRKLSRIGSGADAERLDLMEREAAIHGIRGTNQRAVFWLVTLGSSTMLALFSALNGFSPLEAFFLAGMSVSGNPIVAKTALLYLFAALGGCVACNVLFVRKDVLRGYGKMSYCASLFAAMVGMALARALATGLGGRL